MLVAAQEIERVIAPPPDVFVRRYLRPRRPVVLTGLTAGWLPAEDWTLTRMAREYGDANVVAALLENGTLLDDQGSGVVFRRVRLKEFIASLAGPGKAGHYVMAPTWNFPDAFQRDYRVPAYCLGAAHMRAKVWVGKAGTVTPVHRDVPQLASYLHLPVQSGSDRILASVCEAIIALT